MNSDGRINELVLIGELDSAVERARAGSAANGENGLNPCILGALQHGRAVVVELLHLEMCVGIDEDRSLVVGHRSLGATRVVTGDSPVRVECPDRGAILTSISSPPVHLPKSPPAQPSRPPARRLRSCRSIPIRAAFSAQGWPQSLLSSRSATPAHRTRRFRPPPVEPLFPDRLPSGVIYPRLSLSRRL